MLQYVPSGRVCQPVSPYENLLRRVYRQINSSASQSRRQTVIDRLPDESIEDWEQLLEQMDIEESVRVVRMCDRTAQLQWTNQHRGWH